ncbi:MAG: tetratricopeptide repeat protein [Gemmatimonadetes bacterium]|nr:tetratricopeptide repeat protein [Gemmatimonadota bacterium]
MTSNGRFHLAIFALLAILAAILYVPTFDDEWHLDDLGELTARVRAFHPSIDPSHYRGIVVRWAWALDYRRHGTDPSGYHVTNTAIHLGNSILLYALAWLLAASHHRRRLLAAAAALLFCAHPLATQGVTYLTQRSTSLATLFLLAAFVSWVGFRQATGRPARIAAYATLLATFLAGLYSKHFVLMLPALLATELLVRPRLTRGVVLALLPLFALSAGRAAQYLPRFLPDEAPAATDTLSPGEPATTPARTPLWPQYSPGEYARAQPRSVALYLGLAALPVRQNLDWDLGDPPTLTSPGFWAPALLLLALAATAFRARRRRPLVALGVAWFFVVLVPTSSFAPISGMVFEHRAYPALAGLCLAAAALVAGLETVRSRTLAVGVGLAVVLLAVGTTRRNAVWDTELSLWADTATKSPNLARPHVNYGIALMKDGRLAEAEREFRAALVAHPDHPSALNELGNVLHRRGEISEAEATYHRAIATRPDFANPWTNLGNLALERGDPAEAERCYREAMRLAPAVADARFNLAKALEAQGRFPEAIAEYEILVREFPHESLYANDLGCARMQTGDLAGAERDLRLAIERRDWEVPWFNLGLVLEAGGRAGEAARAYDAALARNPDLGLARERRDALAARR